MKLFACNSSINHKMKTLQVVLFFAFLGVCLSSKFTEDFLLPSDKECIKELGLEIQTVLDSVDDNFLSTEGDPKINEYTECTYRKLNGIDENNELKLDVLKPLFVLYIEILDANVVNKEEVSNAALEFCKNVEDSNLGNRLVKLGNCYVKQIKHI